MTAKKWKIFAKIEKLIAELHPEAIPNERKIVLQT